MAKSETKGAKSETKKVARERDHRLATLSEIADEHSVEPRTINLWVKNGGCPRESRGQYDRKKVNAWKEELRQQEIFEARAGGEDEKRSRARLVRAQADLKEFELAQKHGEFIKVKDAVFVMSSAAVKANNEFDALPKTVALEAVNMESIEEIENFVRDRVNEAKLRINDIADAAETIAKRYSADLAEPAASDSEGDAYDQPVGGKKPHHGKRPSGKKGEVA